MELFFTSDETAIVAQKENSRLPCGLPRPNFVEKLFDSRLYCAPSKLMLLQPLSNIHYLSYVNFEICRVTNTDDDDHVSSCVDTKEQVLGGRTGDRYRDLNRYLGYSCKYSRAPMSPRSARMIMCSEDYIAFSF